MKIVLLEPEFDLAFRGLLNEGRTYLISPLWALSLSTFLKKKIPKVSLTILDARIFPESKLEKWVKDNRPDIAGISPKFLTYGSTLKAARIFKKFGAKVVLGGMHATALKNEILKNHGLGSDDYCINAVIKEDGEKAFYEYINGKPLAKINNLTWRERDKICENNTELLDLDSLPIADRGLVDLSKYLNKVSTFTVVSQKGCVWREKSGGCIFCAQGLSGLRFRKPENVWKEISFLRKKHKIKTIWDSSENFLNDLSWVENFYKIAEKQKDKPQFKLFMRLEKIDESLVKMLQKINVRQALLGVEAGSPQSLRTFRKGITPGLIKDKIKILHKYGIGTFHCFVLGAPGENETTLKETFKFAKELAEMPGHIGTRFNNLVPFPGSPAWQMLLSKTGDKYTGKDFLDWKEVIKDWVNNFCDIDITKLQKIKKGAKEFGKSVTKINHDEY